MCGDTTVSFHALNCRANIVARELLSLGIPALGGLFVGIIAPPGESYVIAVLAILKTGNAFCPIEPEHPARKVKGMCSDAGVQWMVTAHTKAVASVLTGGWFGGVVLQMDSLLVECGCAVPNSLSDVSQCSRNLALAVPDTQAAYVLFTSGSTGGRPLGVCGTHGAALCRFRWSWTTFPWDAATDVACAKTAVSWIDALYEVFGALCQGVPVVVVETSTRKDINAFIKLLRRTRVTRLILTPTLLRVLLPDLLFLPSLKHVTSSGEALPFSLARRFLGSSVTLVNLYGSTEVCGDATCFRMPPMPDPGACDEDDAGTPLGTSITGVCVVIVDPETLAVLPIGEVGELLIYGNTLARGYVGHPEETARRFPILPLGIGGEEVRCFRTGDFGHIDAKGVSHFSGRRDDQVKVKGVRISTHEVELALLEVPGVTAACVVAAGVDPQRLVAFYAPKTMAPTAIITAMQGRLPSSYIPSRAVPLAHLPQLRNGKVDRHKLKQTALRSLKEGTRGPTDPLSDGGGGSTNAIDGFALVVRALSSCSRISSAPTRKCTLADLGLDSLDLMVLKKILEGEVRVFKLLEGRTVNTYLLIAQVPGLSLNIYDDAPLGGKSPHQMHAHKRMRTHTSTHIYMHTHTLKRIHQQTSTRKYAYSHTTDVAQRIDATLCDKDLAAVSSTPLVPRGLDMERDQEGRLTRRGGILACATGDFDVARALVMGGWDARISTDRNGSTALMWVRTQGTLLIHCSWHMHTTW
jgi:amino acid adenylation domain-containing protein